MGPFEYVRAGDVAAAVALVSADPQAQYLAGGTTRLSRTERHRILSPLVADGPAPARPRHHNGAYPGSARWAT